MPSFSGRDARNAPQVGELERSEIVDFAGRAVLDGWERFAVGEGMHILAAYNGGTVWIHPSLLGGK